MSTTKAIRLGPILKELRLHLCQTGESSCGAREFVKQHYVELKRTNPTFPILIRECSGIEPILWARHEFGKETRIPISNLTAEQILSKVQSVAH